MKTKLTIVAALLMLQGGGVFGDDEAPMVLPVQRLSMESALSVAQGALAHCRKQGVQVGVTVVDRNGIVQVFLRDTLAATITIEISKMKAVAAANFNVPTSALGDRANTPIGRVPGLVMSAGALPIQAGGNLLGAVGVSGAPSGETDEACAQAGLDTIIDDLEMAF